MTLTFQLFSIMLSMQGLMILTARADPAYTYSDLMTLTFDLKLIINKHFNNVNGYAKSPLSL